MGESLITRHIRRVLPNIVAKAANGLTLRDGCRNCVANVGGQCEASDEVHPVNDVADGWCILWERHDDAA